MLDSRLYRHARRPQAWLPRIRDRSDLGFDRRGRANPKTVSRTNAMTERGKGWFTRSMDESSMLDSKLYRHARRLGSRAFATGLILKLVVAVSPALAEPDPPPNSAASTAPVTSPPSPDPGAPDLRPSPSAIGVVGADATPPAAQPPKDAAVDPQARLAALKAKYEPLRIKGWNVDLPLPNNTLIGDTPFRSKLADHHLGFYFNGVAFGGVNMLKAARSGPNGTQLYSGQKFTTRVTPSGALNLDLSWLGLENAQLTGGFIDVFTSWDPAGPNTFSLSLLSYYQTFFDKLLELKFGYLANNFEFYGPYVGGNLASSLFGQSASVLTATGLSHSVVPRPGANLQLNLGHYYEKSGIQYSSSPDGFGKQADENPTGFKWNVAHARVLFIQEVGYKRPATATAHQSWVRFGYIRNTSDFVDLRYGGRSSHNYAVYGMADYQLAKFDGRPYHASGFYVGYSAHLGRDRYSRIAQTYEGRFYTLGPFASRPGDMASFIVTYNVFSRYAVEAAHRAGQSAPVGSWQATLAYNVAVVPGLIAGLGLSYSDYPAPIVQPPGTGHALQLLTNFSWFI